MHLLNAFVSKHHMLQWIMLETFQHEKLYQNILEQDSIPVGCVQPARPP